MRRGLHKVFFTCTNLLRNKLRNMSSNTPGLYSGLAAAIPTCSTWFNLGIWESCIARTKFHSTNMKTKCRRYTPFWNPAKKKKRKRENDGSDHSNTPGAMGQHQRQCLTPSLLSNRHQTRYSLFSKKKNTKKWLRFTVIWSENQND